MSPPDDHLTLEHLSVRHGLLAAVRNVHLSISRGTRLGLVGPNGAGKSTLARAIVGLQSHTGNRTLTIQGKLQRLRSIVGERLTKLGIVYVPAEAHVFGALTVRENLDVVLRSENDSGASDLLDGAAERFGMVVRRGDQPASTLSGGEKRLVALARGWLLLQRLLRQGAPFPLLILDEPTSGLHSSMVQRLEHILDELRHRNVTLLLIEQDEPFARRNVDLVLRMDAGTISQKGVDACSSCSN